MLSRRAESTIHTHELGAHRQGVILMLMRCWESAAVTSAMDDHRSGLSIEAGCQKQNDTDHAGSCVYGGEIESN